jgi:fructose-1,6-bisphosphatase
MARELECRNEPEEETNKPNKWERRQHDEVLKWLKEEMDRSQYLIKRSKQMHKEELEDAKKELEKIRKAAKIIIKSVQKKANKNAAKLEANVQSERRQRVKSDKMVECLITSQTNQLNQLRKLTRPEEEMSASCEDRSEGIWGLMGDLDLASVLDELAEEAFQQSYCS